MNFSFDKQQLIDILERLSANASWIGQVFVVVFLALLLAFVVKRFFKRLHRLFKSTDNIWDDALVAAVSRPLRLFIWLQGIAFAAHIVGRKTGAPLFDAVGPLRDIGVIVLLAWFLVRLVNEIQRNMLLSAEERGKKLDITTVDAIGKLLRISIFITAGLVILQTLGYSVSGVLAFGGIGGIAVGFAAKDLLANFFGGLMIYLDRPFAVGDWVRSPDREIEGTVEEIGWRLTRIRTFDKRPLYIPNATFTSVAVENPSRMTHRRIKETIGIRYDDADKMEAILADVRNMLHQHPEIDQSQTLMVNFNTFGPSSLDFFIYTFTRTTVWTEYHRVKEDVLLQIYRIITTHGAEVAFPTQTLHIATNDGNMPQPERSTP
ncbi:MAG TPA: mechanosensitive ion channel family protein [Gammaproteobacteria bacterium]|nr:mechanosensitive ion channel family protein [Gammaproteobacteria bacterium]